MSIQKDPLASTTESHMEVTLPSNAAHASPFWGVGFCPDVAVTIVF